ncbi:ATP-binding protein [Streptomyces sp. CC210A]|uniref:ATP-binding protein n=1 Tax=Streptomyces sp. CC210A TaxID=2898184 RepID=UPI0027E58762|nr:ATP-binding protein [Streptomyces sp. CC210A]
MSSLPSGPQHVIAYRHPVAPFAVTQWGSPAFCPHELPRWGHAARRTFAADALSRVRSAVGPDRSLPHRSATIAFPAPRNMPGCGREGRLSRGTQSSRFFIVRSDGRACPLASERQGRSLIITSNRAPSQWYALFPDPVVAASLLDRPINTSHQAIMIGPGYRTQQATQEPLLPDCRPARPGQSRRMRRSSAWPSPGPSAMAPSQHRPPRRWRCFESESMPGSWKRG